MRKPGFTLIELLIVIVIIGILASIAIPKFGKTREKAYFKAMASDLRTLGTQQELYYNLPVNLYHYASDLTDLPDFDASSGVSVTIVSADQEGWLATATHAALAADQQCGIHFGTVASVPAWIGDASIVACTNE